MSVFFFYYLFFTFIQMRYNDIKSSITVIIIILYCQ